MSRHFFLKINKRNEKTRERGPCVLSLFLFTCRLRMKRRRRREINEYIKIMIVDGRDQCSMIITLWILKCTFKLFQYRFWSYRVLFFFQSTFYFNWIYIYTFLGKRHFLFDWFYISIRINFSFFFQSLLHLFLCYIK